MMTSFNRKGTGLFLLLVIALTVGCSGTELKPTSSQRALPTPPQTINIDKSTLAVSEITDQLGRKLKLFVVPQRIISLAPNNTEIVYALGLGNQVVGVTDYDNYPPEVKNKTSIGGYSNPSIEKVIALVPDLVLADVIHKDQVIPQLETKGLTVVATDPKNIEEILAAISLVAQITQMDDSALIADMRVRIKAVTDKTSKLAASQKPRVFYITWHDPLMTAGGATFLDEFIRLGGGTNVAGDLKSYPTMTLEAVIKANPEVIIAGIGMGEGEDAPLQYAKSEPRLKDVAARQNGRIYGVNSDVVGRAGPRVAEALEMFAKAIHPELFK